MKLTSDQVGALFIQVKGAVDGQIYVDHNVDKGGRFKAAMRRPTDPPGELFFFWVEESGKLWPAKR